MPSKVKDYLSAAEFSAWMDEHGWTVKGLAAVGVCGEWRQIYHLRAGTKPVPARRISSKPPNRSAAACSPHRRRFRNCTTSTFMP